MKRCLLSLIVVAMLAPLARAHFIWIVPDKDGKEVHAFFSEDLKPDDPKLLAKIAKSEAFSIAPDGKTTALKWTEQKDHYLLGQSEKQPVQAVGLACPYGVVQRGKAEPFLLTYYAKYVLPRGGEAVPDKPCARLALEIVSVGGPEFQVLWQGKPLADAEVIVLAPGEDKPRELKTNQKGMFEVQFTKNGIHGLRARHIEAKAGEQDGKAYKEVRTYSTYVTTVNLQAKTEAPSNAQLKPDPAATKLLSDARAARALWKDFPGFTADVEVNFDGKISKGIVHVSANGKVSFEKLDKEVETWAKRMLGSTVGHRLASGTPQDTPCAFADDVKDHPLGRAIKVLNDELHSSYRIKDEQITEVNRVMKGGRFTISMLESKANAEGKFLSVAYAVNYWNPENGELTKNEATYQSWARVGKFDLPAKTTIITATKSAEGNKASMMAQTLTLSNHKLLDK